MNYLVTGGTRGLGLEIVRQQLESGHRVWAVGRQRSEPFELLFDQFSSQLVFVSCDLAKPEGIKEQIFDQALAQEIALDGLVNNAAVAYDDLTTNLDLSQLEAQYRINVFAPMMLTKLVIRRMLLHGTRGSIIHVSSISAHAGYKGLAMYASTKGALEAFSKNVAREWGPRGIRSNCVVPGFMDTDMSAGLEAKQKQRIYERTCLKQPTNPTCVAATVAFLLSPAAASITGQEFIVDAGTV